jgi:predicted cupin superfamily sugar epimerase
MRGADFWIRRLRLEPHPEGGHFRESYRAGESLAPGALPPRFTGARATGTAIFYLLRAGERSRLHRLHADEVWHFYDGGPLVLHLFGPGGGYESQVLGRDVERGERLQIVVPHGVWFGGEPAPGSAFSLAGCTVAPGFDYRDFQLGRRDALIASFPAHRALIEHMTDPHAGASE